MGISRANWGIGIGSTFILLGILAVDIWLAGVVLGKISTSRAKTEGKKEEG